MFDVGEPTLGAIAGKGGTTFRVWAPRPKTVVLVTGQESAQQQHPMNDAGDGVRELFVPGIEPGDRYGYLLDGIGPFPDPCSRRQPDGVHGLSAVVDAGAFHWTDESWSPPPFRDLVIYEAHVGTLTRDGTFESAIEALAALRDMGVSAIELMPVAAFPGRWNWGYDGVAMFAPAEVYGGPDGLCRFVDAAHAIGMAVILDVVYNHFGPAGNYTGLYSDQYFTDRYGTPWGAAMNFDGPGSVHVRGSCERTCSTGAATTTLMASVSTRPTPSSIHRALTSLGSFLRLLRSLQGSAHTSLPKATRTTRVTSLLARKGVSGSTRCGPTTSTTRFGRSCRMKTMDTFAVSMGRPNRSLRHCAEGSSSKGSSTRAMAMCEASVPGQFRGVRLSTASRTMTRSETGRLGSV